MDRRFHILFAIVMIVAAQVACIPSQDCELISVDIHGQVVDVTHQPVASAVVQVRNGEFTDVNLELTTNANGEFDYQGLSVFRCGSLTLTVTAQDFVAQELRYRVDSGLLDSLPEFLTITLISALP